MHKWRLIDFLRKTNQLTWAFWKASIWSAVWTAFCVEANLLDHGLRVPAEAERSPPKGGCLSNTFLWNHYKNKAANQVTTGIPSSQFGGPPKKESFFYNLCIRSCEPYAIWRVFTVNWNTPSLRVGLDLCLKSAGPRLTSSVGALFWAIQMSKSGKMQTLKYGRYWAEQFCR